VTVDKVLILWVILIAYGLKPLAHVPNVLNLSTWSGVPDAVTGTECQTFWVPSHEPDTGNQRVSSNLDSQDAVVEVELELDEVLEELKLDEDDDELEDRLLEELDNELELELDEVLLEELELLRLRLSELDEELQLELSELELELDKVELELSELDEVDEVDEDEVDEVLLEELDNELELDELDDDVELELELELELSAHTTPSYELAMKLFHSPLAVGLPSADCI